MSLPVSGTPANDEAVVISWLDERTNTWTDLATTVTAGVAAAPVAHFTKFIVRFVRRANANKPVSRIDLSHTLLTLAYDQEQEVTATVRAADGTPITGKTVLWVSDTEKNVTVDGAKVSQGPVVRIQGIGRGGGTVHATVDGEPLVKSSVVVSVPHAPVAEVVVEPPGRSLYVGLKVQLTAKAFDPRGQDITAGRIFFWESALPGVATVNDDGLMTAQAPGEADISASCEDVLSDGSRKTVRGGTTVEVDAPDGYFVWGEVAGSPAACDHVNYVLEHKALATMVVTEKYDATAAAALRNQMKAQMLIDHPKSTPLVRTVENAGHMVFGTILVESSKTLPVCMSRQLVVGTGWSYEDALFWAQKGQPTYSDGTTKAVPSSFQLLKHIELP